MTFLHVHQHEIGAVTWGYDTMRPPRVTPGNMARDLLWEIGRCRAARLPMATVAGFLVLRILQRVAYNTGWREGPRT